MQGQRECVDLCVYLATLIMNYQYFWMFLRNLGNEFIHIA